MRALFLIAAVSFATQLPARDVPRFAGDPPKERARCSGAEMIAAVPVSGEAVSLLFVAQRSMI